MHNDYCKCKHIKSITTEEEDLGYWVFVVNEASILKMVSTTIIIMMAKITMI